MSGGIRFDENATCSRCGRFGAYLFDGDRLCADCYETRGACCPEFGADDAWAKTPTCATPKSTAQPPQPDAAERG